MSGHSKWAQIKRQKGVADLKRGALFTKLAREITVAARSGGGDPEMNPRLRLVLQRARAENMPNDNIQRAIKRGTGEGEEAVELHEITYEAYGPGGTAMLVQSLTDNRNRTVADIRAALTRAGGALGETGSVMWNFESKGLITIEADGVDPDEVTLQAIDAGADDVQVEDGTIEVYTQPEDLEEVRRQLEGTAPVASAEMVMKPKSTVPLSDEDTAKALRLLDRLEDLDDVQKVYTNAEFSDAAVAAYSA
jgi:YebC/PmpR family DNA-binding regulatory protein